MENELDNSALVEIVKAISVLWKKGLIETNDINKLKLKLDEIKKMEVSYKTYEH